MFFMLQHAALLFICTCSFVKGRFTSKLSELLSQPFSPILTCHAVFTSFTVFKELCKWNCKMGNKILFKKNLSSYINCSWHLAPYWIYCTESVLWGCFKTKNPCLSFCCWTPCKETTSFIYDAPWNLTRKWPFASKTNSNWVVFNDLICHCKHPVFDISSVAHEVK